MAPKRSADDVSTNDRAKRPRKGFQVGPEHLPDGTYRRRTQKIKRNLIEKAKIRKHYAKIRERELGPSDSVRSAGGAALPQSDNDGHDDSNIQPDRQSETDEDMPERAKEILRRERRHKTSRFTKEAREAQQRREEQQARQQAHEAAMEEKRKKLEERERQRKAMAKARRGGKDGQRKLGRESAVLLEKVQKLVGK